MNRSTIAAKLKKLELLAPLMILFFQTPAVDALTEFKHYVNSKHSYEIDYPSFLKSPAKDATDEVSESCPEQKFISEDESIELSISFSAQDTGKKITLESKWNEALGERKKNADTINSIHKNAKTFSISGKLAAFNKSRIYFTKVLPAKNGFAQFLLTYPADKKEELKPIVNRMISSFKITRDNF